MKIRITLLIICLCSVVIKATAQEVREQKVNTFVNYVEAMDDIAKRKDTTSNNMAADADKYFRLLFLKLKQGRENNLHKPIVPKDKDRYELLDKGTSYMGVVLGFGKAETSSLLIEPLVSINNYYSTKLDLELRGGYFIDKNTAIGGYIGYALSDSRIKMTSPIFELMFNTKDMFMSGATTKFSTGFFVKNFIPLDPDKRVFLVNETSLGYAYSYTLSRNEYQGGDLVRKMEQKRNMVGIGITPGMMYFLTPHLSLEFLISPVLAYYEHNSIINNEVEEASFKGGAINFILTPIKMNFGISYFFGLNR